MPLTVEKADRTPAAIASGRPSSLPRPERMNGAVDVPAVHGPKVASIEGTAIRVRHQKEFRWARTMIGHSKPWHGISPQWRETGNRAADGES